VIGQALLTKRLGKTRVIAETGAGQHGVATATAAALFGFDCTVYMGEVDTERQALNVARMRLLGAEVVPVTTGSRTLKDAINEAYRDWVASVETTNYIFGTAAGPHPFPAMVRDFQKIISEEARAQLLDETGRLPDAVVACVGGGSNAIGMFDAFLDDADVRLYGVEAAATAWTRRSTRLPSNAGDQACCTGLGRSSCRTRTDRRSSRTRSRPVSTIRASVPSTPGSPIGRADYIPATDTEAMEALRLLSRTEGIIPAIESAHALAGALRLGRSSGRTRSSP
jgi:tryptophan synthase beta chain